METDSQKARRIKGYADINGRIEIDKDKDVEVKEINSLSEYVEYILDLGTDETLYYRGHADVNWLLTPKIFRGSIEREEVLIKKFSKMFSSEVYSHRTVLERIAFMQHYQLATRCLDVSYDPLIALYFACSDSDKDSDKEKEKENKNIYGEVLIFREEDTRNTKSDKNIKYVESLTTSIMANCAMLKSYFTLGELHARVMDDNHPGQLKNIFHFQDILSCSVLLEVPFDNPRIRNQRGAFILCNANKLSSLKTKCGRVLQTNYDTLNNMLLQPELAEFSIAYESQFRKARKYFHNIDEWDVTFEKIDNPYFVNHPIKRMSIDPFNINRLRFRNKKNQYVAIVIPPKAKVRIREELVRFGYTSDFVYPEKEKVADFLNNEYKKNESE